MRSFWSGNYEVGAAEPRVAFYIEDAAGTPIGSIEPSTLATPGWHDNWFEYIEEPIDFTYTVYVFIDGVLHDQDTAVCGGETTTTVVIDTTTTTLPDDSCDEDSPSWNDETQSCDLPFTGVEVEYFALGGLLLLLIGAILVWAGKQPEEV